MENKKIWSNILEDLKNSVSLSIYKTWFAGSQLLERKNESDRDLLVVGVKNGFIKEQLETKFKEEILGAAKKQMKKQAEVLFVISHNELRPSANSEPIFSGNVQSVFNPKKNEIINPNHTFDNFVVGASNQIAYLAAKQVGENIGSTYNPLLVYGSTGVGKTHILQAIGNSYLLKFPDAKIIYVSAERFTNDYIDSLNNKSQTFFRQKYRRADALIVDDVQFLAGKESTQDEFFHTFNEIHLAGRQLVLASDRHPKELGRLNERLVSRFVGGMVADIGLPDLEMKIAILTAKCKEQGSRLDQSILEYIASSCEGGVRELEGVLFSILATTRLSGRNLSSQELAGIVDKNKPSYHPSRPDKEVVIKKICSHYEIGEERIKSPSRKSSVVKVRQVLMYFLRKDVGLSLDEIGEITGGRDHSTVIYGVEKIEEKISSDPSFNDEVLRVRNYIRG